MYLQSTAAFSGISSSLFEKYDSFGSATSEIGTNNEGMGSKKKIKREKSISYKSNNQDKRKLEGNFIFICLFIIFKKIKISFLQILSTRLASAGNVVNRTFHQVVDMQFVNEIVDVDSIDCHCHERFVLVDVYEVLY